MIIVADASVAIQWFLSDEPFSQQAHDLTNHGIEFIAPDIVVAEVANIAWRSARTGRITQSFATRISSEISDMFVRLTSSEELIRSAMKISLQIDHPIYDCLYLALADQNDTKVITHDRKFMARVVDSVWKNNITHISDWAALLS